MPIPLPCKRIEQLSMQLHLQQKPAAHTEGSRGAGRRAALLLPWAQDVVLQELANMVDKALWDVASAD